MFDYTRDPAFTTDFDQNPLLPFGPDEVLAIVRRNEPEFAPGTSWSYSDSNYVMLGLIIEKVTAQPVGEAITRLVVEPLGLDGTSYPVSSSVPDPHPQGYVPDGSTLRDVTELNPAVAGAAGAMISTLPDLRRWAKGLATGALLKASTQTERLKPIDTKLSPALDVGYGLGVFEVQGFVGHNGAIYGYNTAAFSLPGRERDPSWSCRTTRRTSRESAWTCSSPSRRSSSRSASPLTHPPDLSPDPSPDVASDPSPDRRREEHDPATHSGRLATGRRRGRAP